ncbi:hypothetical protein ACH5RR_016346 [Cinchona calisaya]|uniref:Uncharacterized protein n=1 Tax=Cinchona calisaya TaxID=153742 RepID=A0ABD2ZVS1_9GENT
MEKFVVLDAENRFATSKIAMKASSGKEARKKLADISNLHQKTRDSEQDGRFQFLPISAKEYIDQLQNENMALMKIVAERNKLIEVTEIELKKLRVNLRKMQQQNLELAQSNSKMLADLNSGKDRLKALQHELGCQKGLLKAKDMEVQTDCVAAKESMIGGNDDKLGNAKRRLQLKSSSLQVQLKDANENKRPCTKRESARFESEELKPSDSLFRWTDPENVSTSACVSYRDENREEDDAPGDEVENKRPFARRQSTKFKSEEPKPSEDLSETQAAKSFACSVSDHDKVQENGSISTRSLKNEETGGVPAPVYEDHVVRRSSVSRPLRQATKKGIDELKHSLLYTTLELETTILSAREELARKDDELVHLKALLTRITKEKDEAIAKCQRLMLEKLLLQKQQLQQTHIELPSSGGITTSNNDQHEPRSRGSSDSSYNNNAAGLSSSDSDENVIANSPGNHKDSAVALSTDVTDKIITKTPLPEKGKFLKAVMEAGPLLQTLLLAGPLPQWQHPPPQLSSIDIPPVTISCSSSPKQPITLLAHQDSCLSTCTSTAGGGVLSKKRVLILNSSDQCSDSSPPNSKYQRVVHQSSLTNNIYS